MFIVRFQGGLGNQMFEYAFLRALRHRYPDVRVKADLPGADRVEHNGYELESVFGIRLERAWPHEIAMLSDRYPAEMRFSGVRNFIMNQVRCLVGPKSSMIEQPDHTAYYDDVWRLSALRSYYFKGVWAHENYYSDVRDSLLNELVFQSAFDPVNQKHEDDIRNTNSVSVHYRGGDYVRVGANLMDVNYYERATQHIEARVQNPRYFIFTDDPQSMKAAGLFDLFQSRNHQFITENVGRDSYKDMRLMSACKHNILANSSFSYWAAELNRNPQKIVISSLMPFGAGSNHGFTRTSWVQI